ncbi:hypothetical protein CRU98_10725 [Arcobacter sp. CECT 8986]|uniref:motility associated factor glycosyltransferase family protein n=1 Tax=Arcobacter sp. CECT 8986 TaxID=2044507 RepID=UPI0010098CE3|nr:6-hydroxymethylpterin diphosphokinase MptE-like protein [Arcobacter sp. CECT 8986]RXJ98227.1 hypothetical protein CRU98_10725 [Arcobacter sp. CECT 8986]
MENHLEELNLSLVKLYLKNMDFLKRYHKKVFEKVDLLSKNIENNTYKEKYSIEYKEEGYLDILNLETNEFIYGINSLIEAELRKEKFDFTQNSSLNLLKINPYQNEFALVEGLGELTPFVQYLNKKIDFSNIKFSKIFKIAYLGTGLGFHMTEIQNKINAHSTLIVEDNLEIFRLSLFTIDYATFTQNNRTLILSIDESTDEKKSSFSEFELSNSWTNYNIKHQLFSTRDKENLDLLIEHFAINEATLFSYKEVLNVVSRTVNLIKQNYPFLKNTLLTENKPLKNKKVLIISGGPSIDKHMEWIQKNQHKFVIVCVDIILRKLEKFGIKPDIITSIDPKEVITTFFDLEDMNFIKDSALIFASQQHENLIKKLKNQNLYFIQPYSISEESNFNLSFGNVGTFSFAISLFLGANEVYLAGSDAAFNQESGSRYSDDKTKIQIDSIEDQEYLKEKGIVSQSDIIHTKGNLKETVKTNRELIQFKYSYENFLKEFKESYDEDLQIFNISEGAYFEGFTPKNFKDIEVNNFEEKVFNKELIDDISAPLENIDFKDDLSIINSMIQKTKKFSNLRIKTKDDLIKEKIDLTIWCFKQIKKLSQKMFIEIFFKFLDLVDSFINFTLHLTQKDLNSKEFLDNLKRVWANTLISLLKNIKNNVIEV